MDDKQRDAQAERIDLSDRAACERWVKKLNVTHEQMREAIGAVGDNASDVEAHLKGVRSSTNSERVQNALDGDKPSSGSR